MKENINIEEFAQIVCEKLDNELEDVEVRVTYVTKNNGLSFLGFAFKSLISNMSPTIFVDDFFDAYTNGVSLEEIACNLKSIYEKMSPDDDMSAEVFSNLDNVKGKIVYKLINKERNREWLESVPHIDYLDLAIICIALLGDNEMGHAVIHINDGHLGIWDIDKEELFGYAMDNTPKVLEYNIADLKRKVDEMNNVDTENGKKGKPYMYVLSNKSGINGAATILYPGLLDYVGEVLKSDYYVLPSSVNEVMIVPKDDYPNKSDKLKAMVQKINKMSVPIDEILSDSIYYFDREVGKLEVI